MTRFGLGGSLKLGRRTALGLVDQLISSATNFALNILVLGSVTTTAYGTFALVYSLYFIARGAIQALVLEPLLVRHTDDLSGAPIGSEDRQRSYRLGLGGGFALSLLGSLLLLGAALVLPSDLVGSVVVLAFVLPGLMLQEILRSIFLAQGRPSAAIAIDSAWAVTQLVLVGSLLAAGVAEVPWLILAWGVSAGVSTLAGMAVDRLWPRFRGSTGWLIGHRRLSLPFLGEIMTDILSGQGVLLVLAAVAGLEAVGTFRSAQILFSPLAVLFVAVMMVGIPEAVRELGQNPQRFTRSMLIFGGSIALLTGLWCAAVIGFPASLGSRLLGDSWPGASAILPELCLSYIAVASGLGALVGLRALAASRASFTARLSGGVVGLTLGAIGAGVAGAAGAALGLGLGAVLSTVLLWVFFRSLSGGHRGFHRGVIVPVPDGSSPRVG